MCAPELTFMLLPEVMFLAAVQVTEDMVDAFFKPLPPTEELHLDENPNTAVNSRL